MRARLTPLLIGLAIAVPGAASAVTIADVLAAPDTYVAHSVTVVGTSENAVPMGSGGMYDLRDGRHKLTVMTVGSPPAAGSHLAVTGTIHEAHVGDADENRDFPHVLVESSRAPAP